MLLGTRSVFKHQDLQLFGVKFNKYELFSPTWSCGSPKPLKNAQLIYTFWKCLFFINSKIQPFFVI